MGDTWCRAEGLSEKSMDWASAPAYKEYYDAEHIADQIIGSMTKEEWDRTGLDAETIKLFSLEAFTSEMRLALFQRIERDCARAFDKLPR